ncbi:MAG: hypothetical protein QOE37_180 [Microbacteriaceae bacterium]|nr:hypothetical protein [Microbacteriaceae bacterium]
MATDGSARRLGIPAAEAPGPSMLTIGGWVVTCAALVVVCLVIGGYGMGWRWTGLSRAVTLWDWLQALLLPVALGLAPVLLLYRGRVRREHQALMVVGLAGFVALIVAGYLIPLPWTGFPGHTLWDWFELALLPLVVTAAPVWVRADRIRRQHLLAGAVALLVFGAFVAAGYTVPLGWTGFDDNTAWDWLKLLLLPLLIPTVVVPLLTSMMHRSLAGTPPEAAVRDR